MPNKFLKPCADYRIIFSLYGVFLMNNLYDEKNRLTVMLDTSIEKNIKVLDTLFGGCGDVVQKSFFVGDIYGKDKEIKRDKNNTEYTDIPNSGFRSKVKIHLIYIDGLTNNQIIEQTIIKPILYEWQQIKTNISPVRETSDNNFIEATKGNKDDKNDHDLWNRIFYVEAQTVDIKEEVSFDKTIEAVLNGDTAMFVDGYAKTFIISSKKYPLRSITENDTEAGMRGPKDSFNEGIRQSTALIRRRIKDAKLRVCQGVIGERSRTSYAIMYMEDLVMPGLVEDIKKRLSRYEIDALFDSGMAEHLMDDRWYSPFPIFQTTTRPDKAAAGIVEGRVVIAFDNSPEVLLAPCNFNMLLQASDDYYNRWAVGTFARFIRYLAAFIAITLPGFYIAVTVYHSDMLPTRLLYAIANARSIVTFPVVVEMLIMEFLFELLREAGIRLPGPLGNTIGVVGGLIVGQAAVEAGIVSTIVVIVVALTAIASFAIPNEEFASVFRLLKFFIIFTSAIAGLYGFVMGLLIIAIHLSELKSFGVPYMMPVVSGGLRDGADDNQDFIFRAPISFMKKRPVWARWDNRVRLRCNNVEEDKK